MEPEKVTETLKKYDAVVARQARQLKALTASLNRAQMNARILKALLEESADLNLQSLEADGVMKVGVRVAQKIIAEIEQTKGELGEVLDLRSDHA